MARPIAKDHEEKRAHILKTAARVFAHEGCARASMAQVAAGCGISKANIYHYYDSKAALLFDILDTYLAALSARVLALPLTGEPPDRQLHLIVAETLLAYEGMDHEHQIQTEGIALLGGDQQQVLKGYQRQMVGQLSDVLRHAAPDALAAHPERLRAATMSVFGMMNWFYMWNRSADKAARQDYADLVTRMTLGGIGAV